LWKLAFGRLISVWSHDNGIKNASRQMSMCL
jgi:hypothetical protein